MNKELFLKCSCGTHGLQVNHEDDFCEEVEFSYWQRYLDGRLGFKERLRWAWRILRTGNPWADHITLDQEDKEKLINFLMVCKPNKQESVVKSGHEFKTHHPYKFCLLLYKADNCLYLRKGVVNENFWYPFIGELKTPDFLEDVIEASLNQLKIILTEDRFEFIDVDIGEKENFVYYKVYLRPGEIPEDTDVGYFGDWKLVGLDNIKNISLWPEIDTKIKEICE